MTPIRSRHCLCVVLAGVAALRGDLTFGDDFPPPNGFAWTTGAALVAPQAVDGDQKYSIKDPSVVFADGKWRLFCTVRGRDRSHGVVYLEFEDWDQAGAAPQRMLTMHAGFFCAPQVFYFRPHGKWYLVCQASDPSWSPEYQPAFSTTDDVGDPESWAPLAPMFGRKPDVNAWLDFWLICNEDRAHLFFTSLDGKMYRSSTSFDAFPLGWSDPVVALEGDVFEASHTYRLKDRDEYLTVIEAQGNSPWRYFKAYTAKQLDGPWTPLESGEARWFATTRNVLQTDDHWTDSISHGELLRAGFDERLEVDSSDFRVVFQGVLEEDREGKVYGEIPWRLGLLEEASPQPLRND